MNEQQIRFLEKIASNGHAALETIQYDGWELRFSKGYTGRANSVSVLQPSDKELPEKVAYCETCYAEHGLPAQFKITDCDAVLQEYLAKKGYGIVTPTDVMILDPEHAGTDGNTDACIFTAEPSAWLPHYFAFEELTDVNKQKLFRRILSGVKADPVYCTMMKDGQAAACASGALEQGYMLLQNVVVDPALRGRGLGEKLCRAMIARAGELGAKHVYLQVVQKNTAAMNLYRKLGFRKCYTYCYMKQPPAACTGNPDSGRVC